MDLDTLVSPDELNEFLFAPLAHFCENDTEVKKSITRILDITKTPHNLFRPEYFVRHVSDAIRADYLYAVATTLDPQRGASQLQSFLSSGIVFILQELLKELASLDARSSYVQNCVDGLTRPYPLPPRSRSHEALYDIVHRAFDVFFKQHAPDEWVVYPFTKATSFDSLPGSLAHSIRRQKRGASYVHFYHLEVLRAFFEYCVSRTASVIKQDALLDAFFGSWTISPPFGSQVHVLEFFLRTKRYITDVEDALSAFGALPVSYLCREQDADYIIQTVSFERPGVKLNRQHIKDAFLKLPAAEFFSHVLALSADTSAFQRLILLATCIWGSSLFFTGHSVWSFNPLTFGKHFLLFVQMSSNNDFVVTEPRVFAAFQASAAMQRNIGFPASAMVPLVGGALLVPSVPIPDHVFKDPEPYAAAVLDKFPVFAGVSLFSVTRLATFFYKKTFALFAANALSDVEQDLQDETIKLFEEFLQSNNENSADTLRRVRDLAYHALANAIVERVVTKASEHQHDNASILAHIISIATLQAIELVCFDIVRSDAQFRSQPTFDNALMVLVARFVPNYKALFLPSFETGLVDYLAQQVFPLAERRRLEMLARRVVQELDQLDITTVPGPVWSALFQVLRKEGAGFHVDVQRFFVNIATACFNSLTWYAPHSNAPSNASAREQFLGAMLLVARYLARSALQVGLPAAMVAGKYWKVYAEGLVKNRFIGELITEKITSPKGYCDRLPLCSFFSLELQAAFAGACAIGAFASNETDRVSYVSMPFLDTGDIAVWRDDPYILLALLSIPGAEVSLRQVQQALRAEDRFRIAQSKSHLRERFARYRPLVVAYLKYIGNGRLVPGYRLPDGFFFLNEDAYDFLFNLAVEKNSCAMDTLIGLAFRNTEQAFLDDSPSNIIVALISSKQRHLIALAVDALKRPTQAQCPNSSWCTDNNNEHDDQAYAFFSKPQPIFVDWSVKNNLILGFPYFRKRQPGCRELIRVRRRD